MVPSTVERPCDSALIGHVNICERAYSEWHTRSAKMLARNFMHVTSYSSLDDTCFILPKEVSNLIPITFPDFCGDPEP